MNTILRAGTDQPNTAALLAALRRPDMANFERVRLQAAGVPFEQVKRATSRGRSGVTPHQFAVASNLPAPKAAARRELQEVAR